MRLSFFILQVLASVLSVIANVEKVVFLGPEQINKCYYRSRVDASHRDVLTPASSSIRREIAATFLSPYNSWKGSEFWIVLDDLEPLRRYEVRLCWSATVCLSPLYIHEEATKEVLIRCRSNLLPFLCPFIIQMRFSIQ